MPSITALPPEKLYQHCDPAMLNFETTADLKADQEIIGQSRATDAIRFGIDIQQPGYNLFVLGDPGSGRHRLLRSILAARPMDSEAVLDWCYINNFTDANKPRLLPVPAGWGIRLKQAMQQFISELSKAIPAAFESDEYRSRIDAIQEAYKHREEVALSELGQASASQGIALVRTPQGFAFAPMKGEEPMAPEDFEQLGEPEKKRINQLIETYSEQLKQLMSQLPRWRRDVQTQIWEASRDTLSLAVGHLIDELKEKFEGMNAVITFLEDVRRDVIEVGEQLRELTRNDGDLSNLSDSGHLSLRRYQVNLLVDNANATSAPVVYEDNPIYPNLVGRVDYVAQFGTLITNFTHVKAGALHRANGGYLVLDALKVLTQPYAWEGLKRALRMNQVRIESLSQAFGLVNTVSLEPEPIPLKAKVLLIGERRVYYLLKRLDPEFSELFKVAADFENDLARDADNIRHFAEFLASLSRDAKLRPFDCHAIARVIEHSARLSGDAEKLNINRRVLMELLQESAHWAATSGHPIVTREDVETALAAQIRRADRIRHQLQEAILREHLLISVNGAHLGQVNGLAVRGLDNFIFAHPVRITATIRLGDGKVIDIERESELGGSIHSKGVMILAAFLGNRYARKIPLSLSASLVFEQSYGPVEGDSASLAELCALLSNLADAPIKQSLAVTGSVNQFGQVQAIGAVNEKIEGFFDICKAQGLTGDQGVLIPGANIQHLMLRQDVVSACADGNFNIYAVNDVDQAIALLTGLQAGNVDGDLNTGKQTINARITAQLTELSRLRRAFSSRDKGSATPGLAQRAGGAPNS